MIKDCRASAMTSAPTTATAVQTTMTSAISPIIVSKGKISWKIQNYHIWNYVENKNYMSQIAYCNLNLYSSFICYFAAMARYLGSLRKMYADMKISW